MNILSSLVGGFVGGLLRGVVGVAKSQLTKKDVSLNWKYLSISLLVSGIVGVVAASLAEGDFRFAFLAGYAGSDFLESLYKIRLKQKFEKEEEEEGLNSIQPKLYFSQSGMGNQSQPGCFISSISAPASFKFPPTSFTSKIPSKYL